MLRPAIAVGVCCVLYLFDAGVDVTAATLAAEQRPRLDLASHLLQDKAGFVWMAGPRGVFRYDGLVATPVLSGSKALASGAHRVFQTRDGAIWIAGGSGGLTTDVVNSAYWINERIAPASLLRLHEDRVVEIIPSSDAPSSWVWAMAESPDGAAWFGTEAGLVRYRNGKTDRFHLEKDVANDFITGLWFDKRGQLWAAGVGGLFRVADDGAATRSRLAEAAVTTLYDLGDGTAALVSNDGVFVFDGERLEPLSDFRDTRFLARGPDGVIWAASERRIRRISGGPALDIKADDALHGFFVDRDGGLWTSYKEGTTRHRLPPWVSSPIDLPRAAVLAVLSTAAGDVWISHMDGVYRVAPDGEVHRISLPGPERTLVFALAEAPNGAVWIMGHELLRWRGGQRAEEVVPLGGWRHPPLMLAVANDGAVWVADKTGGLFRIADPDQPTAVEVPAPGRCPGRVAFIMPGLNGRLWLGSRDGLTRIDGPKVDCFTTRDGLPANDVTHAWEAPDGTLWITMIGAVGLAQLRDGQIRAVPVESGPPRGGFYGIQPDDHDNLWLSSSRGVLRVPIGAAESMAQSPHPMAFVNLTARQGLLTDVCAIASYPPMARDRQGRIWIATAQGVSVVEDPAFDALADTRAEVVSVDNGSGPARPNGPITLRPRPNRIDIEIAAPNFDASDSIRFQARVASLDAGWREPQSERRLVLRDLPPGTHNVAIRVLRPGVTDATVDASVTVTAQAAVHEVTAFRWLAALLLLGLGGLVVQLRRQRERRVVGRIQDERQRIARELHDSLAQTFMGLGFQVDALRARAKDPNLVARLEEIRGMVDGANEDVHRSVWSLRAAMGDRALGKALELVVERARKRLGLSITLKMNADLVAGGVVESELPSILEEALTNAARHGQPQHVFVVVTRDNDGLSLRVVDDGNGPKLRSQGTGFGLIGMRERALQCGGTLEAGPGPEGRGFVVDLWIPSAKLKLPTAAPHD